MSWSRRRFQTVDAMLAVIRDTATKAVLGGGVGSHRALRLATEQYLRENEFAIPELCCSTLGTQAQLFGAVAVSLSALSR